MRLNRNKYGRIKLDHAGYKFDSKLEAAVFDILKLREKAKEISDLKCQDVVYLTKAHIEYRADFSYIEHGMKVFAEAKGIETPVWRLKRRLWFNYGPGPLHIYKGSYKDPRLVESIFPKSDISDMTL